MNPTYHRYEPRGAALEMFHSQETEIILYGGAGTGKTRAHLEKLNLCAEMYPRMRGLMLRSTRSALTETALVTYENEVLVPSQNVSMNGGQRRTKYEYPNGSVVVVGGLDDADNASSIMSGQYDQIHVIECTEIGEKAWTALTTRLRNNRMPYQQLIGCCNPTPNSWVFKRGKRGDCQLLHSRHSDNPTITPQYLEILRKLRGEQGRSLRDGQWGSAGGSVQRTKSLLGLPPRG
ncbi:MAG: phage terminase large subunit [Chloroflexota bacterium]